MTTKRKTTTKAKPAPKVKVEAAPANTWKRTMKPVPMRQGYRPSWMPPTLVPREVNSPDTGA